MRYAMGLVILLACGCSAGEKNYKELDRDNGDPFHTERDPMFHSRGDAAAENPQEAAGAGAALEVAADGVMVVRADEPSVDGLSRSHWPTIRFTAEPGMSGQRWTVDRRYAEVDAQQRFDAALDGTAPGARPWAGLLGVGDGAGGAGASDGGSGAGGGPRSPAGP